MWQHGAVVNTLDQILKLVYYLDGYCLSWKAISLNISVFT